MYPFALLPPHCLSKVRQRMLVVVRPGNAVMPFQFRKNQKFRIGSIALGALSPNGKISGLHPSTNLAVGGTGSSALH